MLHRNAFRLCALLPFITPAATATFASDEADFVLREYTFPLADIEEIEFHASVGTMEFLPIDANEVRLILEIESKDDGWFDRKRDVSDVELESDVRGKRLVLRQTEDGTNTEWTVQMPAVARTTIEMGVGEIDGELRATELEIELGVGDVDLSLPESSTGDVDIAVGVGDARLRGAEDVDHKGAFVSQDISGHGAGALDARIDVGVGEVSLALE